MPDMTTTIFENLEVTLDLNHEGETMGYTNTVTGEELNFDNVTIKGKSVDDYLQPWIQDYMEEWERGNREQAAYDRKQP